jgi:uncharacterized protein DUF5642
VVAAIVLCGTACGHGTAPPQPTTASSARATHVNPANIERVRRELPPGYESGDLSGAASPLTFWGLGGDWAADPPQCAALVATVEGSATRGWSASGRGGIVYAVVTATPSPAGFDPAVVTDCGEWTVTSRRTSGVVRLVDAPHIDGADTIGMTTGATTVVEGGTKTDSQSYTFAAALGEHRVFVTVVTDPGSPDQPLGQDFAADLLVKTVSALRG